MLVPHRRKRSRAATLAGLCALGALLLGSSSAFAEESGTPMRYPPSTVRPKLLAGGLVVTGLGYGGALLTSSLASDLPGSSELQIPIVGPWMSLGKIACPADDPDCGFALYLRGILTAIDGLMQLGGLGIAGEGIFMKTEAVGSAEEKKQAFTLRPAPIVTATTTGIGIAGTF